MCDTAADQMHINTDRKRDMGSARLLGHSTMRNANSYQFGLSLEVVLRSGPNSNGCPDAPASGRWMQERIFLGPRQRLLSHPLIDSVHPLTWFHAQFVRHRW